MWEDISSDRNQYGWIRMRCDAPDCHESLEGRPAHGQPWPYGWEHDQTTGIPRDYCPAHARLAAA